MGCALDLMTSNAAPPPSAAHLKVVEFVYRNLPVQEPLMLDIASDPLIYNAVWTILSSAIVRIIILIGAMLNGMLYLTWTINIVTKNSLHHMIGSGNVQIISIPIIYLVSVKI